MTARRIRRRSMAGRLLRYAARTVWAGVLDVPRGWWWSVRLQWHRWRIAHAKSPAVSLQHLAAVRRLLEEAESSAERWAAERDRWTRIQRQGL